MRTSSITNHIVFGDIEDIVATNLVDWDIFANKRVLITGASGFLPTYIQLITSVT